MKVFYPIKIRLEGIEYDLNYERELQLEEDTINEDLKNQPSFYAYYAVLSEVAESVYSEKKLQLDLITAQLDEKYRKELSGAKSTETMIRNKVVLDENYVGAMNEFNEAKRNVGFLEAIKRSFEHRKDCVIAFASNMRAQNDPNIFVNKLKQESLLKKQ
jgi:hypothetical protein